MIEGILNFPEKKKQAEKTQNTCLAARNHALKTGGRAGLPEGGGEKYFYQVRLHVLDDEKRF